VTRALLGTALLLALAASCEPELSLEEALRGRPCGEADECVDGYECGPAGICVPRGSLGPAGAGGSSNGGNGNDAAAGGSTNGGAGNAGANAGGAAGVTSTDSGGTSSSGAGGAEPDASVAPEPPDAGPVGDSGCTLIPIFRDRDGDGYGGVLPEDQDLACSPPEGWVSVGGDCFEGPPTIQGTDVPERVHPDQSEYFPFGYHFIPGELTLVSFDYDCDGREDPPPDGFGLAPDCSQLSVPCPGAGYEDTGRTGSGVNPACGSELFITCIANGDVCTSLSDPPGNRVLSCK